MEQSGHTGTRPDFESLRTRLVQEPVQDVAERMLDLEPAERVVQFRLLPRERAAEVFAYLSPEQQDALLRELTNEETRDVLRGLPPDDRTALLQELPATVTQRLFDLLGPEELRQARELLGYPPESVGRLMTPRYIAVMPDWTVAHTIEHIRAHAEDIELTSRAYVVDADARLLGTLDLRRLILADPAQDVVTITSTEVARLSAFDDREAAVRAIQHYDLEAAPVVDSSGVLLGIVTVDDVMDVAEEEATEDFHRMGTVEPFRSVRDAGVLLLYRKRVFWLVMLVFANLLTGVGIALYEELLEAVLALAFFLPLVIASGGNAGAQAATLTVRAIGTGEVQLRDWSSLLGKELLVSVALGATVGLTIWGAGALRGGAEIGLVVALAVLGVVVVGSLTGLLLPFALSRMRLDPATASAPLITSIADVVGVLIYFAIAAAVLGVP